MLCKRNKINSILTTISTNLFHNFLLTSFATYSRMSQVDQVQTKKHCFPPYCQNTKRCRRLWLRRYRW